MYSWSWSWSAASSHANNAPLNQESKPVRTASGSRSAKDWSNRRETGSESPGTAGQERDKRSAGRLVPATVPSAAIGCEPQPRRRPGASRKGRTASSRRASTSVHRTCRQAKLNWGLSRFPRIEEHLPLLHAGHDLVANRRPRIKSHRIGLEGAVDRGDVPDQGAALEHVAHGRRRVSHCQQGRQLVQSVPIAVPLLPVGRDLDLHLAGDGQRIVRPASVPNRIEVVEEGPLFVAIGVPWARCAPRY